MLYCGAVHPITDAISVVRPRGSAASVIAATLAALLNLQPGARRVLRRRPRHQDVMERNWIMSSQHKGLPADAAFDLNAVELEEAANKAAGLFVRIYRDLEQRPVAPAVNRAALRQTLAGKLTEHGVGLVRALEDFESLVLPGSMGTPHPLYLGLVNSSPLPGAALADLLISSLNNNGGAFHQSPAMTTCEEELAREFSRLFGMSQADGMFLPGGTFAT